MHHLTNGIREIGSLEWKQQQQQQKNNLTHTNTQRNSDRDMQGIARKLLGENVGK